MKKPATTPREREAQVRSRRRLRARTVRQELTVSPVTSTAIVAAEMIDMWLPGKPVSALVELWVHRRGVRRERKAEAV